MKPCMGRTSVRLFAFNLKIATACKTKICRWNFNTKATGAAACMVSLAFLISPASFAQDARKVSPKKEEPKTDDADLRNWIDVSVGGNFVHGDKPAFQQRTGQPRDAWGGVTDFHY